MALKIGLVGLNRIGGLHCDGFATDSRAEMVGFCDLIPERADAFAAQYGGRAYYRLADMLADQPEIELIDIVTGGLEMGSWHYEPTLEAIAAGKHVMVEKPLSHDLAEAREMVAAAAAKGVCLACDLNHFFTPTADRARQYLDEGALGELICCLMRVGFQGGEPETYQKPTGFPVRDFPYVHLKAFLSHPFSVMRYFCGDITHVQAFCDRPGFRRRANDVMLTNASIHVRFASGASGYLHTQRGDMSYGFGGWWGLEVGGTKGTFCIENCSERLTYWRAPRAVDAPGEVLDTGIKDFNATHAMRLSGLLDDLEAGLSPEQIRGSGRDALAALEYTFAVIESYESGGELVRPHPLPSLRGI